LKSGAKHHRGFENGIPTRERFVGPACLCNCRSVLAWQYTQTEQDPINGWGKGEADRSPCRDFEADGPLNDGLAGAGPACIRGGLIGGIRSVRGLARFDSFRGFQSSAATVGSAGFPRVRLWGADENAMAVSHANRLRHQPNPEHHRRPCAEMTRDCWFGKPHRYRVISFRHRIASRVGTTGVVILEGAPAVTGFGLRRKTVVIGNGRPRLSECTPSASPNRFSDRETHE